MQEEQENKKDKIPEDPPPEPAPARVKPKTRTKTLRFSGLKVIIVQTHKCYYQYMICAFGIGISHMLIGALLMASIIQSLHVGNNHAAFCTAYHCLMAEAILTYCFVNGWSSFLRSRHKRFAHIFLQTCAIVFTASGTVSTAMSIKKTEVTKHNVAAMFAFVLTFMSVVTGFGLLSFGHVNEYVKIIHLGFGLTTFFLTAVTVITGLFTEVFVQWASNTVVYILTSFVIFHTSSIIINTIKNVLMVK